MKYKIDELYVIVSEAKGLVYYNPYDPERPLDIKGVGPLTIYRHPAHARDAMNYLRESMGGSLIMVNLEQLKKEYLYEWVLLQYIMAKKLGSDWLDKFPPYRGRVKCGPGDLFTVHRVSLGFRTNVSVRYKNMNHFETNADHIRLEQIREIYKAKLPGVHSVCLTYSEQPYYLNPDDAPDVGEYGVY